MLTIDELARALGQSRWRTWRLIWTLKPLMQPLCCSRPGQPFAFNKAAVTVLKSALALLAKGVAHRDLLAAMSTKDIESAPSQSLEMVRHNAR